MGSILSTEYRHHHHFLSAIYLSACSSMIDTNTRNKSEGLMATSIGYPSHGPGYSHIPRTPSATTESTTANNTLGAAPFNHFSPLSG